MVQAFLDLSFDLFVISCTFLLVFSERQCYSVFIRWLGEVDFSEPSANVGPFELWKALVILEDLRRVWQLHWGRRCILDIWDIIFFDDKKISLGPLNWRNYNL
jgi:hypothetical protein